MRPAPALLLCLAMVLLSWAVITPRVQARSAPWDIEKLPSTPAPAFSLPDLEGNTIASASFQGQLLLINFWATWCAPCREEMPALERLQQKFKDKGVTVIAIAIDHDKAVVKQFINTANTHFPVLHDPGMTAHDAYKVYTYPTTFLVDRKGIIRQYWMAPQEWDGEEIGKTLQGYLH